MEAYGITVAFISKADPLTIPSQDLEFINTKFDKGEIGRERASIRKTAPPQRSRSQT